MKICLKHTQLIIITLKINVFLRKRFALKKKPKQEQMNPIY